MPSSEYENKLYAKNLRKSYKKRLVVRNVSLELKPGEVVGLLGPNGSGKTTSFYTIAGLVKLDSGELNINGQDMTCLPMYRRSRLGIGYLPQETSIFRGLNVEKNILSVLQLRTKSHAEATKKLDKLLADFSIDHLRHSPSQVLSGGERRRVEIARCMATNPRYLLLDEPFAGVDPIAVGDIRTLVSGLKSQGLGILITDHNVHETLKMVDRAYILHDGTIIKSGTPKEVINDKAVRDVYLGQDFSFG